MVTKEDGELVGEAPGCWGVFPTASPGLLPPAEQPIRSIGTLVAVQ